MPRNWMIGLIAAIAVIVVLIVIWMLMLPQGPNPEPGSFGSNEMSDPPLQD